MNGFEFNPSTHRISWGFSWVITRLLLASYFLLIWLDYVFAVFILQTVLRILLCPSLVGKSVSRSAQSLPLTTLAKLRLRQNFLHSSKLYTFILVFVCLLTYLSYPSYWLVPSANVYTMLVLIPRHKPLPPPHTPHPPALSCMGYLPLLRLFAVRIVRTSDYISLICDLTVSTSADAACTDPRSVGPVVARCRWPPS